MPRAWPLVGRGAEIERVRGSVRDPAASGMVVAGAAGVGKTRLAREALAFARSLGCATAWAAGTLSARTIPFGALAHLLPAELPTRPVPANLLRALADALVAHAGSRRFVLGVDDAHLLDPGSASLLHHLALMRRAFVLATVRSGEPVPDAIAALWKDEAGGRLDLEPLSRRRTEDLLEQVLGGPVDGRTRESLWQLTRGNPLFLREIIQTGMEEGTLTETGGVFRWAGPFVGPRLMDVVESRVGGLQSEERTALEAVAIAEPLEIAILETLVPHDTLVALEQKGLLLESVDHRRRVVHLSHGIYAEVLRASTPSARFRRLYRDLAHGLEAREGRRREDLLRIATWHMEAGMTERPLVLAAAAERALRLFDARVAERLARTAIEADWGVRAGLPLAGALVCQGRFDEAERLLEQLEPVAGGDAGRVQVTLLRANNLAWHLDSSEIALGCLDAGLEAVADPAGRDALAAGRAYLLAAAGRMAEAIDSGLSILARADLPGTVMVYAYGAVGHSLLYSGRPAEALALLERHEEALVQAIDETPFGPAAMGYAFHRYLAAVFCGRFREAADAAERAYRVSIEERIDWWTGTWAAAVGWVCLMQGRLGTAIRWLREGGLLLREMNAYGHLTIALAALAHALAQTGAAEASEQALAEASAQERRSTRGGGCYVSLARAWSVAARGELSRAVAVAIDEARSLESQGFRLFAAMVLHDVARLGQPARVVQPLDRLATECQGALAGAFARHARALADADAGALERASREFEGLGGLLLAAEAAAEASAVHRKQGSIPRAAVAGARARSLASRCEGACTPALAAIDGPEVLTRREREVVALATRRLSNREIARRLGVSVRTVDNHLHHAYAKLQIGGRGDLRRLFQGADSV